MNPPGALGVFHLPKSGSDALNLGMAGPLGAEAVSLIAWPAVLRMIRSGVADVRYASRCSCPARAVADRSSETGNKSHHRPSPARRAVKALTTFLMSFMLSPFVGVASPR